MENEVREAAFKYNYVTPEEYLQEERKATEKHEYFDGQVLAMSGASIEHNSINANLIIHIGAHLKGKNCKILPSGMRVSTSADDAYMYPDASIVCGEPHLQDNSFDTLLNPIVIFEILSPSTRSVDKGRKLFFYQRIPSLQEYIMIDAGKRFIQLARKQPDGHWKFEELHEETRSLQIQSIEYAIELDDIYANTLL